METDGWHILAWDFPQSGTGRAFRLNTAGNKNAKAFIPDILAEKHGHVLWFENKTKVSRSDLAKCRELSAQTAFLSQVRKECGLDDGPVWFGIGLPTAEFRKLTEADLSTANLGFAFGVGESPGHAVEFTTSTEIPLKRLP